MIHFGRQVRLSLIAIIPFAAPLPAHADQQHRLQCPVEALAEWGLPKPAPLVQVAVLSQPVDQTIDDNAPPSSAPSVLRRIRVAARAELKQRILAYLNELNREPVVHTWSYRIATSA
jgi:hypothetical protein